MHLPCNFMVTFVFTTVVILFRNDHCHDIVSLINELMPCSCINLDPCQQLITEAQLCAIEFLGTVLSLLTCLQWHSGGHEPIFELSRRLLSVQKDLGLRWEPDLSTTMVSLFTILVQSELEHEQISISKLLLLILKWKYDKGEFSIAIPIFGFMQALKLKACELKYEFLLLKLENLFFEFSSIASVIPSLNYSSSNS